jgi:hypothetical protein
MTRLSFGNKYGAKRTWSNLCNRWFASKAEALRGDELFLLQKGGVISELEFQRRFVLHKKPIIAITIDFKYKHNGKITYEDVKGILTRDFRTKLYWLKDQQRIDVILTSYK